MVIIRDAEDPANQSWVLIAHAGWATSLGFSPDSQTLLTGGTDGIVRTWHGRTPQQASAEWSSASGQVTALTVSPDGQRAAIATEDGRFQFMELVPAGISETTALFSDESLRLFGQMTG
jgi:WD40 repeat protein